MSGGPYRGEPTGPRWVCLACYRYASAVNGLCPRCAVDLLSLDQPAVREELRAEAERRMQQRHYAEYFGLHVLGAAIALPVLVLANPLAYIGGLLLMGQLASRAYMRLRPSSAMALYADRRRRLDHALAGRKAPRSLPAPDPARVEDGDPEELPIEQTLAWLGARIDDAPRRR